MTSEPTSATRGAAPGDNAAGGAKPPPAKQRLGGNLALAAGTLLVSFLLCEGGARLIARAKGVDFTLYMRELTNSDRLPQGLQAPHATLRWSLNPGQKVLATTSDFSVVYSVNGKGLRDQNYPYKKPADKIRMLALGDSLTFGEGIPYGDRYTDIAEAAFPNLEILTMAVPGYGFDQDVEMLVEEGVKYHPDVVMFCLGTTILSRHSLGPNFLEGAPLDAIAAESWADDGPSATLYRHEGDGALPSGGNPILRHSYLVSYLTYRFTLVALRHRMEQADLKNWGARNLDDTKTMEPGAGAERMRDYLALGLRRVGALAKQYNFKLVLLNIDPALVLNVAPGDLPPGTQVLDLGPDMRAEAGRRTLRFKYDPHYNPETNRFLGKKLADGLKTAVPGLKG